MIAIQFKTGVVLTTDKINDIQEKIKRVLKEELPADGQTGEVIDYILLDLKEKKTFWKVEL